METIVITVQVDVDAKRAAEIAELLKQYLIDLNVTRTEDDPELQLVQAGVYDPLDVRLRLLRAQVDGHQTIPQGFSDASEQWSFSTPEGLLIVSDDYYADEDEEDEEEEEE
jgi:hypothetical protein